MTKLLVLVTGATTFLLCVVAVREQAELTKTGYAVSELEQRREKAVMDRARARERVGRLRAPAVLARLASDLGFTLEYPRELPVVMVRPEHQAPRVLVQAGPAERRRR